MHMMTRFGAPPGAASRSSTSLSKKNFIVAGSSKFLVQYIARWA
jgi:hypothetical protein